MIHCVNTIIAAMGSMNTLSVFNNLFMREYFKSLDPKHKLPHRLERTRLVEVLIDGTMMEFCRITKVKIKWHLYLFILWKSHKHSYPSACHFFSWARWLARSWILRWKHWLLDRLTPQRTIWSNCCKHHSGKIKYGDRSMAVNESGDKRQTG